MKNVYVVTTYTAGTGGFDWFPVEADAREHFARESKFTDQETHYVGAVEVPDDLDRNTITDWLDSEGRHLWERRDES